jgi:hypothetical protein
MTGRMDNFGHSVHTFESATYTKLLLTTGSSNHGGMCYFRRNKHIFPTYLMVFTGKSLSRMNLQYEGALEHLRAQAPAEAGYLIMR